MSSLIALHFIYRGRVFCKPRALQFWSSGWLTSGTPHLCFWSLLVRADCCHSAWLLGGCQGPKLQSLCLPSEVLYPLSSLQPQTLHALNEGLGGLVHLSHGLPVLRETVTSVGTIIPGSTSPGGMTVTSSVFLSLMRGVFSLEAWDVRL